MDIEMTNESADHDGARRQGLLARQEALRAQLHGLDAERVALAAALARGEDTAAELEARAQASRQVCDLLGQVAAEIDACDNQTSAASPTGGLHDLKARTASALAAARPSYDALENGRSLLLEVEDCLLMAGTSLLESRKRFATLSGLLGDVGSQLESARIALEAIRSGLDAYEEAPQTAVAGRTETSSPQRTRRTRRKSDAR